MKIKVYVWELLDFDRAKFFYRHLGQVENLWTLDEPGQKFSS